MAKKPCGLQSQVRTFSCQKLLIFYVIAFPANRPARNIKKGSVYISRCFHVWHSELLQKYFKICSFVLSPLTAHRPIAGALVIGKAKTHRLLPKERPCIAHHMRLVFLPQTCFFFANPAACILRVPATPEAPLKNIRWWQVRR